MSEIIPNEEKSEVQAGEGTDPMQVGSSLYNLGQKANAYNEGQKNPQDKNDSNGDGSNNDGSDGSDSNGANNGDASVDGDSPGSTPDTGGGNDVSPPKEKNPDGTEPAPQSTQPNAGQKSPNNKSSPSNNQNQNNNNNNNGDNPSGENNTQQGNPGNQNATGTGIKPGDVGGESGTSTNAGTINSAGVNSSMSAEKGGEAAAQTAQSAEQAKQAGEAAKEAAEVAEATAEGAAEGSVVPGVGTVVVAALRAAWALRHTIYKVFMSLLMVLLIPICSISTLPSAIWSSAFEDDGSVVEAATIESVYKEYEQELNEFLEEAYNESKEKAQNRVDSYGSHPELNELVDASGGYQLDTDACSAIAHFTVMCRVKNKEATPEYFRKCLDNYKLLHPNAFFPREEEVVRKLQYDTYIPISFYTSTYSHLKFPVVAFMMGDDYDNYKATHGGRAPFAISEIEANGGLALYGTNYGAWNENSVSTWWGPIYQQIGNSTLVFYYALSDKCLYAYDETLVVSEADGVGLDEKIYVQNVSAVDEISIFNESTLQLENKSVSGLYITGQHSGAEEDNPGYNSAYYSQKILTLNDDGFNTIKVTINKFEETDDMWAKIFNPHPIKCSNQNSPDYWTKQPYPLVADIEGEFDEATEGGLTINSYTPDTYLCGMAITDYITVLRDCVMSVSGTVLAAPDGVNVYKYRVMKNGSPVRGIVVTMYSDPNCTMVVQSATTDANGVATFKNFGSQKYYIKETRKTALAPLSYTLKTSVTTIDNTKNDYMVWEYAVSPQGYICPLQPNEGQYVKITSYFGYRPSPTEGASSNHGGLDMVVDQVGTDINQTQGHPVRAAKGGTVTEASYGRGYGNYVIIKHDDGWKTLYAHNSSLAVKAGDTVKQGQTIAFGGNTGVSTGAHCHFEVRNPSNVKQNPADFLQFSS